MEEVKEDMHFQPKMAWCKVSSSITLNRYGRIRYKSYLVIPPSLAWNALIGATYFEENLVY